MSLSVPLPDDGGPGGEIGGGGPTPTPTPTPGGSPTPPPANQAVLPDIVASSVAGGVAITYLSIPLIAAPSQVLNVQLSLQACRIAVYQKRTGLYLDLFVNDVPIVVGVLCRDRTFLIRNAYLGFTGDLLFVDAQGASDPDYTGLGSRFALLWGYA